MCRIFIHIAFSVLAVVFSSAAWATPQAVVRPNTSEQRAKCSPPAEAFIVAVVDSGKEIATASYCSDGGPLSAQLVVDGHGKAYVFVRMGERQRDGAVTNYVAILEMSKFKNDRTGVYDFFLSQYGRVLLPAESQPGYRVIDTPAGGLEIVVDYLPANGGDCCTPPEKQVSIRLGP